MCFLVMKCVLGYIDGSNNIYPFFFNYEISCCMMNYDALFNLLNRFLSNTAKDMDLRKWAAEGLAYLTLDAEIKEELTYDHESIKALIEVAKVYLIIINL